MSECRHPRTTWNERDQTLYCETCQSWVLPDDNVTQLETCVINASALDLPLADSSVDLIITSPPYFALRSYRDGDEHYDGQIGSEPTPQDFLEALWAATREMVRVLKPTGSIWVNLGDKYAGSGGHNNAGLAKPHTGSIVFASQKKNAESRPAERRNAPDQYNQNTGGIPAKSLMGLPWRYAIGCVDQLGLILRAEVIWSKPNGLPESVTDRVRRSHEQWFHFTKQGRYFAAVDEVREASADSNHSRARALSEWDGTRGTRDAKAYDARPNERKERGVPGVGTTFMPNPLGKLPGSVWTIPSEPLLIPEAVQRHYNLPDHFAAFPTEWPRRIILGWSPAGICTACGEGRRPVVERETTPDEVRRLYERKSSFKDTYKGLGGQKHQDWLDAHPATITGYACACPDTSAPTRSAVVLDPFGGTGTVAMVARTLGRVGISVDLSADYCRLAQWRIFQSGHGAKAEARTWAERQTSLLEPDTGWHDCDCGPVGGGWPHPASAHDHTTGRDK